MTTFQIQGVLKPEPCSQTGNSDTTGKHIYLEVPSGWMLRMEAPHRAGYSQASGPTEYPPFERANHPEGSSYHKQDPYSQHQFSYPLDTNCRQEMYDPGAPLSFDEATGQSEKI